MIAWLGILKRLISVMIQAEEQTDLKRKSTAVVNIPIPGDDNSPQMDKQDYQLTLSEEAQLTGETAIKVTDVDTLIKDNTYEFKILSSTGANSFFKLVPNPDDNTEATIAPQDNIDTSSLPPEGVISCLVQATDTSDDRKFGLSLVTVTYDFTTTGTVPPTPTECPTEPCTCDPDTSSSEPVTTPQPTTCEPSTCDPCECTTVWPTTPASGDEKLAFTTGDFMKESKQSVGFPAFIPLENAVRNPLAKVHASCNNQNLNSLITYSIPGGSESFYIDSVTGDIFLINNNGGLTLGDICPDPCSLQVTASIQDLGLDTTMEVKVYGISEEQVLVFWTSEDFAHTEETLSKLNAATQNIWFSLLNAQPGNLMKQKP